MNGEMPTAAAANLRAVNAVSAPVAPVKPAAALPLDAYDRFHATRYFGSLDGLRAISILAVLWHHAGGETLGFLGRGFLGVELFFAISGFLITTLLLRERARDGEISLPGFYVRRTLRIFPLYYAVVAIYAFTVLLHERHSEAGQDFFHNLPYFLTYTSNWFVNNDEGSTRVIFYFAWSLATEEQFYLLWPWVVRYTRNWYVPCAVMTALILAHAAGAVAADHQWLDKDSVGFRMLYFIATPICLGAMLAYAMESARGFAVVNRFLGRAWSAPIAFALMWALIIFLPKAEGWCLWLIHPAMVAVVGAVCIRQDHVLRPLLANAFVRYLGTISYGMYLMHMLCLNVARKITAPRGLGRGWTFLATVAITVVVATISYRFFESWFLRLKDRLGHKKNHGTGDPLHVQAREVPTEPPQRRA